MFSSQSLEEFTGDSEDAVLMETEYSEDVHIDDGEESCCCGGGCVEYRDGYDGEKEEQKDEDVENFQQLEDDKFNKKEQKEKYNLAPEENKVGDMETNRIFWETCLKSGY